MGERRNEINEGNYPVFHSAIMAVRRAVHARYPAFDSTFQSIRYYANNHVETMVGYPSARIVDASPSFARDAGTIKVQSVLAHETGHIFLDGDYKKSEPRDTTKSRECRAEFFSDQLFPGQMLQVIKNDTMLNRGLLALAQALGDPHPTRQQRIDMLESITSDLRMQDIRQLNFSPTCKITKR